MGENLRWGCEARLHVDRPCFDLGGLVRIPGSTIRALTRNCSSSTRSRRRKGKAGPLRLYRMPTALERQGNFSETFDDNGALIFVKDPVSSLACSVTAGGAGCFPGNIIPAIGWTATGSRC